MNVRLLVLVLSMVLLLCLAGLMNIFFFSYYSIPSSSSPSFVSSSYSQLYSSSPRNNPLGILPPSVRCRKEVSPKRLIKKTKATGMACPIFRDEEGFLSEFIAYYQLHGLDHIKLYDDWSTDNSLVEVEPWVQSGFVSVESNISGLFADAVAAEEDDEGGYWQTIRATVGDRIALQFFARQHCLSYAIDNGFDFLFTLDIDEYIVPNLPKKTIMDTVYEHALNTTKSVFTISRVNFASNPHIIEPIEQLTIEAYILRMRTTNRLSYFQLISPKTYYYLRKPVSSSFKSFLEACCDIHSCSVNCTDFPSSVQQHTDEVYNDTVPLSMFHYARSLEKYDLKQRTWDTYGTMAYSLTEFLDRNLGRVRDVRARLRYSCQVREILQEMTNESEYLRPGDYWYKNLEHNKSLLDESKTAKMIGNFSNWTGYMFKWLVER